MTIKPWQLLEWAGDDIRLSCKLSDDLEMSVSNSRSLELPYYGELSDEDRVVAYKLAASVENAKLHIVGLTIQYLDTMREAQKKRVAYYDAIIHKLTGDAK